MLIVLFFATVPNLGFFTPISFALITFLFIISIFGTGLPSSKVHSIAETCFVLLFYACIYYGGLYQNSLSTLIGSITLSFIVVLLVLSYFFIKNKIDLLFIILLFYIALSFWTLIGSPKPLVDTFDVFREVAGKIISGVNPYSADFSRTYAGIDNHFHYLPFSFVFTTPFMLIFGDPRIAIIFANIVSVLCLRKIFMDRFEKKDLNLLLATFLFLPRSFYILEHMYLDPIIFMFFLLFYFSMLKKKRRFAMMSLGLFFSFKQNLLILFPLFLLNSLVRQYLKKEILFFLMPFALIILFIILNPPSFLMLTFLSMFGAVFYPGAPKSTPTHIALSFQVFIRYVFPNIKTAYLYVISILLLTVVYLRVFAQKKYRFIERFALILFAFGYFMHLSFFNQYYFLALFYFFNFMFEQSSGQKKDQSFI
ncbi:hypothetical protein A2446_01685 [Candidatus Roizmanbacteria bacterium RIFOXYC2_FULL_38_9]|nr:MAG: hypothetical protein A2446_01685 [Candidatus Roizmanbacteria bacterium RIFOXYC2_FULL_38_9]